MKMQAARRAVGAQIGTEAGGSSVVHRMLEGKDCMSMEYAHLLAPAWL